MGQGETKRRYDDACGLAHALDLIGERWSMLILRELAYGSRRFSEIKADLPGISANVLTQRLAELERRGLVVRRKLPPPASVQVYEATPWALEAATVIGQLGRWAARSPQHDPTLPLSHAAIMMSLETMIDAGRAGDLSGTFEFSFGDIVYTGVLGDGRFAVTRAPSPGSDVRIAATPHALAGVIYNGAPIDLISVEGDVALAKRFFTLFPLPAKAY
ncbi:helix-turn-helix transcriptional regulator [Sphingomonas sabuli]|uniref:Helix-turn-helix transcriptional regulator n=1 Tax=Sphingomonas sabuli TaxID=2764186 RepID=A0A7G9L153_9SPHN|nr:helix-turn-helix domain-containing protein [Sphingomonas sabuli]QNM82352.1 helix-turn-helix transcriptional regulator [Sphingomonas sabuli]